jgi:alkylation response protein AidB-like acyl-CoA dehydrogenase
MALGVGALNRASTNERARAALQRIAAGDTFVTAALTDDQGRVTSRSAGLQAAPDGSGFRLSGTCAFVPDAMLAEHLVLLVHGADGSRLVLIDRSQPGVVVTTAPMIDTTRAFATVQVDGVLVPDDAVIVAPDATNHVVRQLIARYAHALAADAAGGAARVVEISADYARERIQFGRPIGSFQAIKHLCVDMLVRSQASSAAVERSSRESSGPSFAQWSSIAKSFCGDAAVRIATDGVQVHGGIGYTWEHDMHLYLKRALLTQRLSGDSRWHRNALAQQLLQN